jgi:hypothetical protein
MQVSGALESDKFAMMGGGKTHSFTIKSSAHTFRVLSNSLYGDKYMAVARELICNVIDIHNRHGIDAPVVIELTDNEVKFIDQGPGICDTAIGTVYLTYFGSDKTDDAAQIGGFGLGCKAPFALSEHFRVESNHKGFKRIYALTIGSTETNGEPAATEMVCVPTTDVGLTVAVPLDGHQARNLMERCIYRVARDGGIPVMLNGELITNIRDYTGFEQAGYGFYRFFDAGNRHSIAVRYGHVLYPVEGNDAIQELFFELSKYAIMGYQLVLHAPPNSIAVQPSRERLSYEDLTIATLKRLMERFLRDVKPRIERQRKLAFIEGLSGYRRHEYVNAVSGGIYANITDDGNTPNVGPDGAARIIARSRLLANREITMDLHRLAMSYYRDRGIKVDKGFTPCRDQFRYVLSRVLRAIMPTVPEPDLLYRSSAYVSFEPFKRLKFNRTSPIDGLRLTVVNSRTTAISHKATGLVLVGRFNEAEIAGIQAGLERYHFKFKRLMPFTQAKKPKPVKVDTDLFVEFDKSAFAYRNFDRYTRYAPGAPTLALPFSFLPLQITRMKDRNDTFVPALDGQVVGYLTHEDVGSLYDGCAVPLTVKERDRLVEMGVPRVGDMILARLRARIKKGKDDLFTVIAGAMHRSDMNNYPYSKHETRKFATNAAYLSRRLACAVFGETYRHLTKLDDCWEVWRQAKAFFTDASNHGAWLDDIEKNAFEVQRVEFEKIMADVLAKVPDDRLELRRLARSSLTQKDVLHMNFLASIVDLTGLDDEERLARLIEADAKLYSPKTVSTSKDEDIQCAA